MNKIINPLKFGFHNFLNAQPLLIPLLELSEKGNFKVIQDTPSSLADSLIQGKLDLAMIPSIEFLKNVDQFKLFPNISISSKGPVGTVLLITQKPLSKIKTVGLDSRSRTSVTLLRLLFQSRFSKDVKFNSCYPEEKDFFNYDAMLVIGDQAFKLIKNSNYEVFDLSEEWYKKTQKTFVHAVVAVSNEVNIDSNFLQIVQQAKKNGEVQIENIIKHQSALTGIDENICRDYLQNKIIYDLGKNEMEGLTCFQNLCVKSGILSKTKIINSL